MGTRPSALEMKIRDFGEAGDEEERKYGRRYLRIWI
jgi:hypothetical protein